MYQTLGGRQSVLQAQRDARTPSVDHGLARHNLDHLTSRRLQWLPERTIARVT